ncbi:hypothetical protein MRX96_035900 [Rhipicephalus microplus]
MSPASLLSRRACIDITRLSRAHSATNVRDAGRHRSRAVQAGAAILTPTTVERSPSRPDSLARVRTRLTRGALNAAPKRYDVTPWGTQEAAHRGANTKRRRQNTRKPVADDVDTYSNFSL